VQRADPWLPTPPRYLWLCRNLLNEGYYPLAIWLEGALHWANGAPPAGLAPVLAEMVDTLEPMLQQGIRFNQTGYGAGNIQERDAFLLDKAGCCPVQVGSRVAWTSQGTRYAGVVRRIKHEYNLRTRTVWLEALCDDGEPNNPDLQTNLFTCAGWYSAKHLSCIRF